MLVSGMKPSRLVHQVSRFPLTHSRTNLPTSQALLQHNAKVYLAARSKEKADKALAELKEATGKEAIFLELDLASLRSVRNAAKEFLSKEKELHILFNNAYVLVGLIFIRH